MHRTWLALLFALNLALPALAQNDDDTVPPVRPPGQVQRQQHRRDPGQRRRPGARQGRRHQGQGPRRRVQQAQPVDNPTHTVGSAPPPGTSERAAAGTMVVNGHVYQVPQAAP